MSEAQSPYTTTNHKPAPIATYHVVIALKDASCNPAALFNPDGAADRFAWMNAIQRGYLTIERVFEIKDAPADGDMDPAKLLAYKVVGAPAATADDAPAPSSLLGRLAEVERRLSEHELATESQGDEIAGLLAADEELSARVDAGNAQHGALADRVMGLTERVTILEGACRDCVWVQRQAE